MPLTNAERQKRYREKLKHSERYEEIRVKHLERVKKSKKKIKDLSKEDQEIQRQKWREEKRRKNNASPIQERKNLHGNSTTCYYILKRRNIQLALENQNLRECIIKLTRTNNKLRQQNCRLKIKNYGKENVSPCENESNLKNITSVTPRKKTENMLNQLLTTPENRETIKKEIFQLNVLSKSLQHEYATRSSQIKTVLKNVVKNEVCQKYKVTSKLPQKLGLIGRIRSKEVKRNRKEKKSKEIESFFCRDDVSRATAGKKECLTKKSIKKQKRYLLDSMVNVHKMYRESGGKSSYTTFIRHRPFYVVTPKICERDTCACIRHSNLSLKAQKLKKLGMIMSIHPNILMLAIACDTNSKVCMYGECSKCKNKSIDISVIEIDSENISWLEWELKKYEYKKTLADGSSTTKVTKKFSKAIKTGDLNDLLSAFQREAKTFRRHFFNIRHQQAKFRTCKDNLRAFDAVIICDFSENYATKYHEEIQSIHFGASRNQISLHTGVIYTQSAMISFCSLSPSKDHGPGAIWAHLQPVIEYLKKELPEINVLHFFTDGPCTQYKQKNNFFLLTRKVREFNFWYITWNFFEASHGKGAADGIGGAIKRQLDQNVAYGIDIQNAEAAFKFLSGKTKIKLFYISEEAVHLQQNKLDTNFMIMALKGTMQIHQVIATHEDINVVKYRHVSCFCGNERGLCDCFELKEHELVDTRRKQRNQTKSKRKYCKRPRLPSKSSYSSTETENIVYAESDDSPWEENVIDPLGETSAEKTTADELKDINRVDGVTATQSHIKCVGCEEDLISDVEEDELKNIGCDKCPRWFHLKCTVHKGRPFAEVAEHEFVCHVCYI